MNLKIRKLNKFEILFTIYILLEARFFYLISLGELDNIFSGKNKLLMVIVILVGFCIVLLMTKCRIGLTSVNIWCMLFVLYAILEAVRNYFSYNLSFSQWFLACHGYVILLLTVLLSCYKGKKDLSEFIINLVLYCSVALSLLFIIQAFVYNSFGISFVHIAEYTSFSQMETRSLGIRLTAPSTLIIFSVIMSWGYIIGSHVSLRKNKLHYFNVITGLIYIIYTCQTRVVSIMLICTLILVWGMSKTGRKFSILNRVVIVIMAVLVITAPTYFADYFDSSTGSVYARLYAYDFFFSEFKSNPLLGIGLLPDDKTNNTIFQVLHGNLGYANLTDVGITGYLAQFGIVGIVFLIAFIYLIIRILKKCKIKGTKYWMVKACSIYMLASCSTLSIFDIQRIVILPVILYLLNCLDKEKNGSSAGKCHQCLAGKVNER